MAPAFENGRIVVLESKLTNTNVGIARLGIMKRPENEVEDNNFIFCEGYHEALRSRDVLGSIQLNYNYNKTLKVNQSIFFIETKPNERSKGYGTVLMNAGAEYCRNAGVQYMYGEFGRQGDTEKRERFYESLGMPIEWGHPPTITANVNNPRLNAIDFEEDPVAAKVLNSIPQLQRHT